MAGGDVDRENRERWIDSKFKVAMLVCKIPMYIMRWAKTKLSRIMVITVSTEPSRVLKSKFSNDFA